MKQMKNRSKVKNKFSLKPLWFVILVFVLVFGAIIYFRYASKVPSSPVSSRAESVLLEPMVYNTSQDSKSTDYPNYKHYVNKQANFSIDYPEFLTRTEYYPINKEGVGIPPSKLVYFCEKPLDTSKLDFTQSGKGFCDGAGIEIQYDGDGWGGGCDEQSRDTILMMGKQAGYCSYPTSFGQLYYSPPRGQENNPTYNLHKFLLSGVYGTKLTKAEVGKTIASFTVKDPKK